ncbi:thioester domain-containing protein [Actinosynnema pretiosum subsp. pretiosum]|uniref:LPXTG-motif cell wall anchor domain protein n=2 Tax=Actinosynnema TaxID=40566 RepID=C6WDY7_ACTMD|nr:thioester domain-containing protein [Actinosynnema mirum]ACU34132.1 LPXTG-motif cell wall anchor domain protein [Actinosynnema mirum DSM 43827]AXX27529.1 Putative membrane protein [Actinosynnema pretiosum subsp. pretiosum]QUF01759.1 thioester domain-containing protein [Actinosynnema pretiosum subsp. pretiosum]
MASRLLKRAGAIALGASIALTTAALPASATAIEILPIPRHDPDFAKFHEEGIEVKMSGHKDKDNWLGANLIALKVKEDGKTTGVKAYCVELPTPLENGTPLTEVPWGEHPNSGTKFKENADKINWILQNSYPVKDASVLSEATGKSVSKREAIAATQAAIWHFSDGADLDTTKDRDRQTNEDVKAVYAYLIGEKNVGIKEQPAPSLAITPKTQSGKPGDLIGPFEVSTTAGAVVLKADLPQGVTLVDAAGATLKTAAKGDASASADTKFEKVFVKVPEGAKDGQVSFSLQADAKLNSGRLFVSSDKNKKTQSLVVALPSQVTVKAEATASWKAEQVTTPPTTTSVSTSPSAPAPSSSNPSTPESSTPETSVSPVPVAEKDELASTGASIFVPLLIGLGLLGAGAAAMIVMRRRKTA